MGIGTSKLTPQDKKKEYKELLSELKKNGLIESIKNLQTRRLIDYLYPILTKVGFTNLETCYINSKLLMFILNYDDKYVKTNGNAERVNVEDNLAKTKSAIEVEVYIELCKKLRTNHQAIIKEIKSVIDTVEKLTHNVVSGEEKTGGHRKGKSKTSSRKCKQ